MERANLISVIVPVYNTKSYLFDCVNSILNQTYSDFELILVDDGSTDGSDIICDELALKDNRIKVFHQENRGLSLARNAGVEFSCGKYICFVDSDDVVSERYLEILYDNLIKSNADVSFCGFCTFSESIPKDTEKEYGFEIKSKNELLDLLTDVGPNSRSVPIIVAWNKIIKRGVAEKISFPKGRWHEDEFYVNRLMETAEVFSETPEKLYCYRQREGSIVSEENKNDIRHLDIVDAFEERIEVYRRFGNKKLYRKIISSYRITIIIQYFNFLNTPIASKLKKRLIKSFFKYPYICFKMVKSYFVFMISPTLYYKVYFQ